MTPEDIDRSEQNLDKGPISWMARNSVAANLLMMIFIIGGIVIARQVKQEVFPEFSSDIVQVNVPYPGASPEEVEQGIILSIEDGVRGLEGVKRVTSTANEGAANIVVELLRSATPNKALQDIKNEVDRISSFPEEAERPVVSLIEIRKRVVSLIVSGKQDRRALRDLAEKIRGDLVQRPGVTFVELGLAPPLEIAVEVPLDTLRRYSLTLEEIANQIRTNAIELPGGEVRAAGGRVLLRTQERRDFASEFENIPVATNADGTTIFLSDIAQITDTFRETDEKAEFNDNPAVLVEVYRVGDETPQSVSKATRKYIEELQPKLSQDIELVIWEDNSEIYQDRMYLLTKNAVLGLVLVLILLGLFLEVRLAFWVTLGIPISVLGCFLFFPFTGASINMISLFAFIVTLGIIVDDAVVMGENIYENREKGMPALKAAIVGARQISTPILFAVLTNIVAFMPLFFVPGVSGKFFGQIPAVVVTVFIVSLIESIFILPAHLAHEPKKRKIWDILNSPGEKCRAFLDRFIQEKYAPVIAKAIKRRYATMAIAIAALLIALGTVAGGHIGFTFIPKIDADVISAQVNLPFGSPVAASEKIKEKVETAAKRAIEQYGGEQFFKGIYAQVGRGLVSGGPGGGIQESTGGHILAMQVSLVAQGEREFTGTQFARTWRKEIGRLAGIESITFKYDTGASEGPAIEFNLSHSSRIELEKAAKELRIAIEQYAGATDTKDGVASGKKQFSMSVTPEARSLGISSTDLARQVRASFFGAEALRQQRGRNEVKVMVRLPLSERQQLDTVENLIIKTPQGGEMMLSQAAVLEQGRSYTEINRRDGRRIIAVTAEVDSEVSSAGQIIEDIVANTIPTLEKKYPGLTYSFGGEREAQQETLGSLGTGFAIAMLAVFALLAIPFKSYTQPIIVMLGIPFGIIGAVIGHFILGYGLSIISMFGIIALAGVVVNDSLVLVVTANNLRSKGANAIEAVTQAGMRRFRPIILTSLTTFLGLTPMIFETSMQARFLIPMAISIGFGILFATVIILIIVPSTYIILEDVKSYVEKKLG